MNKSTQTAQITSGHGVQKFKSTLTPESIDHLKDLALDNRVLDALDEEDISIEELEDIEQNLDAKDKNFRSELDYNGYKDIESYDNDEYRGNMDNEDDDAKELNLSDRPEGDSITEESVVDKQENHRNS
jgi:hypothetical protein